MEDEQATGSAKGAFDLEDVVRYLPVMLWTATPAGALDFVCGKTCAYFGRTFDQMIEWGWATVVHPDDLPNVGEHWSRSLETGAPYALLFRLRRGSDGSFRRFAVRAHAKRDENGNITKWFGVSVDIEDLDGGDPGASSIRR